MEHVEVLERLRGVLEHGKMDDKCLIAPDLVTAAIAALSAPQPPAEAQGVGEALEAELIALVAGPYHYHHKMDEHAEREGKAFDRCRELTIQNIRTWCATRRAMLAAQPPSAPVGVEGLIEAAKAAESMLRTVHECASHECEDCREYAGISAKQLRAALRDHDQEGKDG